MAIEVDPLAVSLNRVQRFEGKLNICRGKQLSVPRHVGTTSLKKVLPKPPNALMLQLSLSLRDK